MKLRFSLLCALWLLLFISSPAGAQLLPYHETLLTGGPGLLLSSAELSRFYELAEEEAYLLEARRQRLLEWLTSHGGEEGAAPPEVIEYTVREGDTLWDLALAHGTDVQTLLRINGISHPSALRVGQRIKILTVPGTIHEVRAGDSLWRIARMYQVEEEQIIEANGLEDPSRLQVGQELIVPGAKVAATAIASPNGELAWPLRGRITSSFGMRWGRMHYGIDIAASHGTTVRAAASGKVIYSGWKGGYGNTVMIDHGDGVVTLYAHNSSLLVRVGQRVSAGQPIARVGSTGRSTGPHLHFEVRIDGKPQDPLLHLP